MRNPSLLYALATFAALACGCNAHHRALPVPGPVSGDPVALAYTFTAGDVWRYDVQAVQTLGSGDAAPRMGMSYVLALRFVDVSADGNARVALAFEGLKIDSATPMPASFDLSKVDISLTLTPDGRTEDVRIATAEGQRPEAVGMIVDYVMMPFRLSPAPVRLNEPWTGEQVIPTLLMGLKEPVPFQARSRSWISAVDEKVASVQHIDDVSLPTREVTVEGGQASGPIKIGSKGVVQSLSVFDRKLGRLRELDGRVESKLDVVSADDRTVIATTGTTTMRLHSPVASR